MPAYPLSFTHEQGERIRGEESKQTMTIKSISSTPALLISLGLSLAQAVLPTGNPNESSHVEYAVRTSRGLRVRSATSLGPSAPHACPACCTARIRGRGREA